MDVHPKTTLAERFRHIIESERLNYSKLAKIAGVTPQAINDIANGVINNPKISTIVNIASNLDINPTWLLTGEGQIKKEALPSSNGLAEFFRKQIEEKDRQIFEKSKQIYEQEEVINQLVRGRVGKREGVLKTRAALYVN